MNSGLCGLIMAPVFTSTLGGALPEARASASSRWERRSEADAMMMLECDSLCENRSDSVKSDHFPKLDPKHQIESKLNRAENHRLLASLFLLPPRTEKSSLLKHKIIALSPITMAHPANDDGNCLPSSYHHSDDAADSSRRGGFEKVQSYESHDEEGKNDYHGNHANDDDDDEKDVALSLNELMYSAHSFHVISLPVSVTMILAALAVTYVNTPETIAQGAALMSQAYHVWKVDAENDSTSKQLALDFANGLVIVTVIGTMTFGIVLLYKYRCMKVLIGYMMFSSMTLLGVLGAELFNIAIEKYRIPIDWFSFVFGIYNFAVVGVTAIFYATGIPTYVTQAYLICSSVIISWQLSHFDTISTWTLLIMLGLYDLCAVLTPCGPLRALVNLMSDEDSPEMPGLLYEATIPEGLKRPVMSGRRDSGSDGRGEDGNHRNEDDDNDDSGSESSSPPSSMAADRYQQPSVQDSINSNGAPHSLSTALAAATRSDSRGDPTSSSGDVEMSNTANGSNDNEGQPTSAMNSNEPFLDIMDSTTADQPTAAATVMIPLAIAKLYRLPLISSPLFLKNGGVGTKKQFRKHSLQSENISTSPLLTSQDGPTDAADDDSSSNPSEDGSPRRSLGMPYVIPDGEYTPCKFVYYFDKSDLTCMNFAKHLFGHTHTHAHTF